LTEHYNRRRDLDKRRTLRRTAPEAERKLWQALRDGGVGTKFRRQYSVDGCVLDFYAPQSKLAVEVDGDSHFTPEAMAYAAERTRHLASFGIEVLRVTNAEVCSNLDGVLSAIGEAVRRRRGVTTSP
jgi:very-short-patch-repair endonuclease